MARIQENALKKNPRLRILDIRIANSQPKILNQKMSPSYRIPSIQVPKIRQEPLPPFLFRASRVCPYLYINDSVQVHTFYLVKEGSSKYSLWDS